VKPPVDAPKHCLAGGVVLERVEGTPEFDAAARNVRVIRLPDVQRGLLIESVTALFDASAVGEDLAGENQRLRSRPRWGEATLGQQNVGADLLHAGRLD